MQRSRRFPLAQAFPKLMTVVPPSVGGVRQAANQSFLSTAVVSRTRATLDIPEIDPFSGTVILRRKLISGPCLALGGYSGPRTPSKFAMHGFSQVIRPELATMGVGVLVATVGPD
jgi:hypothetical protein